MWVNRIRELREQRGWTVKQMSEKSGIGSSTINTWERNGGVGKHIPDKYHVILSKLFKLPITDILWDEQKDFSSVDVSAWADNEYSHICKNCLNYIWEGKPATFGHCSINNQTRRFTDNCTERKSFSYKDECFPNDSRFVRSQIRCYCGNCISYKIREEQNKCTNTASSFCFQAMPHSSICRYWEDSQGNKLPECIYDVSIREGIIKKRITQARKQLNKSMIDISEELSIELEDWKAYEKGLKAIPINELIAFASKANISFEWFVGLTDVIDIYKNVVPDVIQQDPEIKSIRIISYVSNNMITQDGDDIKQKITISKRGDVCFTRYFPDANKHDMTSKTGHYSISKEPASELVDYIASFFLHTFKPCEIDGVPEWKLELIDINNKKHVYKGPIGIQLSTPKGDLSDIIRKSIWRKSAIVFDGNNKATAKAK